MNHIGHGATLNGTIAKFGYPSTLVQEYSYWVVLVRPAQLTLGSLIVAAKSEATDFGSLPVTHYVELKQVAEDISSACNALIQHEKLNWLMLMMVDPHVHFHLFPRYQGSRQAAGLQIEDQDWPGPPDLKKSTILSEGQISTLVRSLQSIWPKPIPR